MRAFGTPLTDAVLKDEAQAQAFRRRVGVVFQSADVQLFSPTVRDEIAFGLLHLGLPAAEVKQRVQDMLALLELEHLAARPPYRLSGGEKKKVALAAVLASGPQALLFDEPTAGLDPRTQDWLVELLQRLHETGKTLVPATHQLTELPRLADRALVLAEDHSVAAELPVAELLGDRELLLRVTSSTSTPTRTGRCCTPTRTRTCPARTTTWGRSQHRQHAAHRTTSSRRGAAANCPPIRGHCNFCRHDVV